jgi:hypothetical protein
MRDADLLRPPKRSGEARDRRGQVLRVGGHDIQQLAREDGVDRLAVAVGEAFQGQDLEAGDAHFQAGEAGGARGWRRRGRRRGRQLSLS